MHRFDVLINCLSIVDIILLIVSVESRQLNVRRATPAPRLRTLTAAAAAAARAPPYPSPLTDLPTSSAQALRTIRMVRVLRVLKLVPRMPMLQIFMARALPLSPHTHASPLDVRSPLLRRPGACLFEPPRSMRSKPRRRRSSTPLPPLPTSSSSSASSSSCSLSRGCSSSGAPVGRPRGDGAL